MYVRYAVVSQRCGCLEGSLAGWNYRKCCSFLLVLLFCSEMVDPKHPTWKLPCMIILVIADEQRSQRRACLTPPVRDMDGDASFCDFGRIIFRFMTSFSTSSLKTQQVGLNPGWLCSTFLFDIQACFNVQN